MAYFLTDTSATSAPLNNTSAAAAPTVNNDETEGYSVGSVWLDVNNDESYKCFDASTGAAVWVQTSLSIDELGALAVKDTINNDDWSGSALAVANGGTGSTDAATARTALGAASATDLSTHIADTANPHSVTKTQVGLENVTNDAQLTIANNLSDLADAATARTNLDVPSNATFSAHATSTANPHSVTAAQVGLGNVLNAVQLVAANNLSDLADAATARTNLGLGTIATQAASGVNITGGAIVGITDLAVADGGTGASTAADARTNLGLGTIATQAANSVNIDGGAIDGATIGASTPSTGVFTTVGINDGSVSAPGLFFNSDPNCGIFRKAADDFAITVGGEEVLRFIDSGVSGYASNGVIGHRPIVTVSATKTLALTDANTHQRCDNGATAIEVTVPPNSTVAFNIGTEIELFRAATGTLTVVAGSGVTINSKDSLLEIGNQYTAAVLKKVATNTWDLVGNLA